MPSLPRIDDGPISPGDAPLVTETKRRIGTDGTSAGPPRPAASPSQWRLIGQYSTVEAAQRVARDLRARGIETSVSLLGGLSVIARN